MRPLFLCIPSRDGFEDDSTRGQGGLMSLVDSAEVAVVVFLADVLRDVVPVHPVKVADHRHVERQSIREKEAHVEFQIFRRGHVAGVAARLFKELAGEADISLDEMPAAEDGLQHFIGR